ncbi:hypothetical protein TNCV_4938761 [Trichonephila clavipes]|nr:hypothetical protein TNCV_4938761 [Trichonephila clavipes]
MARRNHLDDFTRGRMIEKAGGTAVRKVDDGRRRTTTAGDDRYIILQAKRGRRSASVIAQQLSTATGRQVSRFTMARRLHKKAYSPAVLNAATR